MGLGMLFALECCLDSQLLLPSQSRALYAERGISMRRIYLASIPLAWQLDLGRGDASVAPRSSCRRATPVSRRKLLSLDNRRLSPYVSGIRGLSSPLSSSISLATSGAQPVPHSLSTSPGHLRVAKKFSSLVSMLVGRLGVDDDRRVRFQLGACVFIGQAWLRVFLARSHGLLLLIASCGFIGFPFWSPPLQKVGKIKFCNKIRRVGNQY